MLYAGGGAAASSILRLHNGANVFVRRFKVKAWGKRRVPAFSSSQNLLARLLPAEANYTLLGTGRCLPSRYSEDGDRCLIYNVLFWLFWPLSLVSMPKS